MHKGVDVRVSDVDRSEIDYLTNVVGEINSKSFQESLINSDEGGTDFVVTIKKCELDELKEALRIILQVVNPERIEIDT